MDKILNKIKDTKGLGMPTIVFGIFFLMLIYFVFANEFEHRVYIEQKDRIEDSIKSACKAAIMQVDKTEEKMDIVYDAEREKIWKNVMQIDKKSSNELMEEVLCKNIGLSDKENIRKHLVLRAYSEPQLDGSVNITIFNPTDYGGNIRPLIIKINKTNEEQMKKQIENEINTYLANQSINGKTEKISLTSMKSIPEFRIYKPSIIVFLQQYPIRMFIKQDYLNVLYVSPVNIERKIR